MKNNSWIIHTNYCSYHRPTLSINPERIRKKYFMPALCLVLYPTGVRGRWSSWMGEVYKAHDFWIRKVSILGLSWRLKKKNVVQLNINGIIRSCVVPEEHDFFPLNSAMLGLWMLYYLEEKTILLGNILLLSPVSKCYDLPNTTHLKKRNPFGIVKLTKQYFFYINMNSSRRGLLWYEKKGWNVRGGSFRSWKNERKNLIPGKIIIGVSE